MADFFFQTRKLTVGYDGKALIRNIDLGINRGEILTLIGPNGSGKSTILKSITRQLKPIAGTVFLEKEELTALPYHALAKRMAVVLTERTQPELMRCRDVVATGRYPYTGRLGLLTPEDEEKVRAAMERVHALELAERDFNAISDGQRQRVLLARAICQEPEILLLDEPTSYLDIRHKLELLRILRDMAREKGMAVITSLHEIDLAQKISDKVMCVKGDTISCYGTPEEVFRAETIRSLYDLEQGSYDPCFGSVELPAVTGVPQVFVLSAGGTGVPVFRRLQKENIPFAAGVLYSNDVDCHLARQLAVEVVEERAFFPISEQSLARAEALIRSCGRVINAGVEIGETNRPMAQLLVLAESLGKLEKID